MSKKLLFGCAVPTIILIIGLIGLVIYFLYLGNWYDQVQAAMPEVKKKLIDLNHATLTQILPPDGMVELTREDLGVNTISDYGVDTIVNYRIENPEQNIQAYYQSMLDQQGWNLLYSTPNSSSIEYRRYSFNETCLRITTYPQNKEVYDIIVFHDFQKQSFSPKLPPLWYVQGIREMGKTNINTCP